MAFGSRGSPRSAPPWRPRLDSAAVESWHRRAPRSKRPSSTSPATTPGLRREKAAARDAANEVLLKALRASPDATIAGVLATWDLPGAINLRPSGRLVVHSGVSGAEGFLKLTTEDDPPSPYRVDCWRDLRRWEAVEPELDSESWRSVRDVLERPCSIERGARHTRRVFTLLELLHVEEDADVIAALLAGGRMTVRLALFCSYVWWACRDEGRPYLVGSIQDLAELLGCSPRQAWTIQRRAKRKGLVTVTPNFLRVPQTYVDRDGRRRGLARTANLYAPGLALKVAWLRSWGEDPPPRNVTPPRQARARTSRAVPGPGGSPAHAIPGPVPPHQGSREDRTDCDPTAREDDLGGTCAPLGPAAGPAPEPSVAARSPGASAPPLRPDAPLAPPPVAPAEVPPASLDASATPGATDAPRPAGDRGEARGPLAASRQLPPESPHVAGELAAPAALIAPACKDRASDGKTARAPAAAGRPVISPAQAARLPDWFTRELSAAMRAPDPPRACAELLERGQLWLSLTASGTPPTEADVAVERLRGERQQRQAGRGPGAVCCPQRGDP